MSKEVLSAPALLAMFVAGTWAMPSMLYTPKSVDELQLMTYGELIMDANMACVQALATPWRLRESREYIERIGRVVRHRAQLATMPAWVNAYGEAMTPDTPGERCTDVTIMALKAGKGIP